MRIKIHAVGTKMPSWVEQGCQQYLARLSGEMAVTLRETPLAKRRKNPDTLKLKQVEAAHLLASVNSRDLVVAMEVSGKSWSTRQLAHQLGQWRDSGNNIVLMIGGPDGLADQCLQRAEVLWSLSPLTLPHPLVRVVLAEQLYRAWTILKGHPYHRE